jgi:hypothetical protein
MERNKDKDGAVCSCANCSTWSGYGHRYFALRWLLGLIVIAMAFGLGLKVGEFKGYFDGMFGRNDRFDYYGRADRMPFLNISPSAATPTTTTGSTSTKAK